MRWSVDGVNVKSKRIRALSYQEVLVGEMLLLKFMGRPTQFPARE